MPYYEIHPEVGGNIFGPNSVVDVSLHPPSVSRLDYQFDGWSGDDIVTSFPCYIVTKRLAQDLRQSATTGFEFDHADVSKSEQFEELYPDVQLPEFVWLKITGRARGDDFGMTDDNRLVVSERALRVLQRFRVENCEVGEYTTSPAPA